MTLSPRIGYRRVLRGLTLLEVIVAMTILSFGIVGALGAISACLRSNNAAARYSRGALLAQQVAAELERNETLEEDTLSGAFDDTGAGYTWEAVIEAATEEGLYPVRVTVLWDHGTRQYRLDTLLRPHPLPTAGTETSPGNAGDNTTGDDTPVVIPPGGNTNGGGTGQTTTPPAAGGRNGR